MRTKTGIVMQVKGNTAYIMTQSGEFEKVKITHNKPEIGEIYTGIAYKKHKNIKYFVSAASIFLCVALAGTSYAYYNPANSVIVKLDNIDAKIYTNIFNKIIKIFHNTQECSNIMESLKLKNKDINNGLTQIINASKEIDNKENLLVEIKNNSNVASKIDIEKFKENLEKKSIDYVIDKETDNRNNSYNNIEKTEINKKEEIKRNDIINNSSEDIKKIDETIQNNNVNEISKVSLIDVKEDEKNNKKNNDKNNTKNKIIIEINNVNTGNKNKKEEKEVKKEVKKEEKEIKKEDKKENNKNNDKKTN